MADKGKRPAEQQDSLSLIDLNVPTEETIPDSSSVDQPDHGMQLVKLTPETDIIPYRVPVCSPASEHGKGILDELENIEEGFFAEFPRLNGIDPQNPEQMGAILSHPPKLGMQETSKQKKAIYSPFPADLQIELSQKNAIRNPIPVNGPAYESAKAIFEKMENTEDGFFAKFLRMNRIDPQNPQLAGAGLSNPTEKPGSSKGAGVLKTMNKLNLSIIIRGTRSIFPPGSKKAAQQDRLLQLYIEDPKHAKRLVLNRLSALRLRMKKKMCKGMFHQKVDNSKPESYMSYSQLERAPKNTNDLKAESTELKAQMLIERQIQLLNDLNKEINNEIEYLRSMTGLALPSSSKNALIVAPELAIQKTGAQHNKQT